MRSVRRWRMHAAVALALSLAAMGCARRRPGPVLAPGSSTETMQAGGRARAYVLHVPPRYSPAAPAALLLVLHGFGGNGLQMEDGTKLSALADTANVIVLYPDGLRNYGFAGPRHWATVGDDTDIEYLRALIEAALRRFRIDSQRVYVAGFSNGATMTYRAGAELSDRIAAIGLVAGSADRLRPNGTPAALRAALRPISVVAMHGVLDDRVPYSRGASRTFADAMAYWRARDECLAPAERQTSHEGNLVAERSSGCAGGTELLYYTVVDGHHTWFTPQPDAAHAISST
ncbi:MAG: PHB depolymerase family esterase, partial [Gemmatimonadaceae bacterium]